MPDWGEYHFSYDTGTANSNFYVTLPSSWEQEYEHRKFVLECERQDRIMEQMMCEDALRETERAEDRRKYPLFFWRENI